MRLSDLDPKDVAERLDGIPELRGQQMLQLALLLGVLMFAAIVAFLHFFDPVTDVGTETSASLIEILTLAHIVLIPMCWFAGALLQSSTLNARRLEEQLGKPLRMPHGEVIEDPVRILVNRVGWAGLIRLAMLEAAALFGIVICLLAHLGGVLTEQPMYWLNLASAFLFLVLVVTTFPNKERVLEVLRRKSEEAGMR